MNEYDSIGKDIIGSAFNVRKNVGRGLLEKFYEGALAYELSILGHMVSRQVEIPAVYQGEIIGDAYRADIIVDNKIIIEIKAISEMTEVAACQLFTYLKLSDYKLGYLINFGAKDFKIGSIYEEGSLKFGIYRIVNKI